MKNYYLNQSIVKKWGKYGLLQSVTNDYQEKIKLALLLENQLKIIEENDFGQRFKRNSIPLLIKVFIGIKDIPIIEYYNEKNNLSIVTDIEFKFGEPINGMSGLDVECESVWEMSKKICSKIKELKIFEFKGIGLNKKDGQYENGEIAKIIIFF